jgi:hypothetical protein
MKVMRLLIFYALLILVKSTPGQPDNAFQKQLDELRLRIKILEKENQWLKSDSRVTDSLNYCAIRLEIFEAFSNESQLDFDFKSTTEKILVTGLFARLMQANNPASDILGFRFTDLVFASAEKHFIHELENESDKKRFIQIISKIINNPLISTLASSNPITSVVSTIISTIVGFTTTSISMDKEGGRVRDVSIGQSDAFDEKNITAFRNDMQVYINFYDQLILASQKYLSGLENLNNKYLYLEVSIHGFLLELHTFLDLNGKNELICLTNLLPDPSNPEIDFKALLMNENIRQTALVSRKFPALQITVNDFKNEYNLLLFRFLDEYTRILESAKAFPDQAIDKNRIDELIAEIKSFINKQKLAGHEQPDVFLQ